MMNGRTIRRTAVMMVLLVGATGLATALPPVSVGLATAASTLDGEPVGQATVSGSVRAARWFDLQLTATAIHPLERSYQDSAGRDYQSETVWTGIGFRPFVTVGQAVEIGLPIRTANGVIQFRYERPYRDEVSWTEEILDRETVAVNSIGVDVTVAVSDRWSIVAEGGGRVSSPIRTVLPVDEQALNTWYAGIGATYRLEANP